MMIIWNFWGWCWWTTEFSSCETSPFLILYFCLYLCLCLYLYLYLCLTMIISKKFRGWWSTEFSSCETSPFLNLYFCLYLCLCLYLYLYLCLTMIISKKFRGWWSTEFSSCVPSPSLNTSNVIVASGKHSDSTSENFKPNFSSKWEKATDKIKPKLLLSLGLNI